MNDSTPFNELVVIEPSSALAIFTTDKAIDPLLERIRREIDGFSPNIETTSGRKEIASMAYKVSRAKTYLDDAGKELVAEQKKIPNKIDATRKRLRDTLDKWRDEVRAPLTAWEEAEEDRINRHKADLNALQAIVDMTPDEPMDQLLERQRWASSFVIDDKCDEFATEYAILKDTAMKAIGATIAKREVRDAEQAELARLRKAEAERLRIEREADIASEAAEQARKDADAKALALRKAAEDAGQKERDAAEKRELDLKLKAEQAERRAAEALAAAKQEIENERAMEAAATAAREADKAHRARLNKNALDAFVRNDLDEATAKRVITLIVQKAIPNIVMSY